MNIDLEEEDGKVFKEPLEASCWFMEHSNDDDDEFASYKEAIERILLSTKYKNKPIPPRERMKPKDREIIE